jgi:hypothetical protein
MNITDRKKLDRADPKRYDYMYARHGKYGGFDAMGVINNGYAPHSVIAGQDMICFVDNFETTEAMDKIYPQLSDDFRGEFTEPQNYFDHLPDTGDF